MAELKKLILVDDQTLLRQALAMVLARESDMKVVAEAKDGAEAIREIKRHHPDLLILNMHLPASTGFMILKEIKKIGVSTRVLVLTDHNDDEKVRDVLKSGVEGYCLKSNSYRELLRAIRSVLTGGVYLCPEVAGKVLSGYLNNARVPVKKTAMETISSREKEVLSKIAEGRRNEEIAELLSISVRTVQKHRANLMDKLDLHSVAELTAFAIQERI